MLFQWMWVLAQSAKTEAIRALNPPTNVMELRWFLIMSVYYCELIANYAQLALPLYELTHDGQQWKWGSAEQNVFEQMKQALYEAPVMDHPHVNDLYILYTDAVIMQLVGFAANMIRKALRNPFSMSLLNSPQCNKKNIQ